MSDRPVASSLDELLSGATSRLPLSATDSKSGVLLERVEIDGETYILKHLHVDDDWIMRSTGDVLCRPLQVWRTGLLDQLPSCIDHAVVGAADGLGRNGFGAALLMHDRSDALVPSGDEPVLLEQHLGFMNHMAAMHAAFWGWRDTVGLCPPMHRYLEFAPASMALEEERGWPDPVPPLIVKGWAEVPAVCGRVGSDVLELAHDPTPLVDAIAGLPQTLLHGDWKMGNLGTLPDGRTVLLDWASPGQGSGPAELAWYLALNAARLPQSKEASIDAYRNGLERNGVSTDTWFQEAVDLTLLGGAVLFLWEKALHGHGPELSWWLDRAATGLARL